MFQFVCANSMMDKNFLCHLRTDDTDHTIEIFHPPASSSTQPVVLNGALVVWGKKRGESFTNKHLITDVSMIYSARPDGKVCHFNADFVIGPNKVIEKEVTVYMLLDLCGTSKKFSKGTATAHWKNDKGEEENAVFDMKCLK
ncbi:MAG: hypothetical protein HYS98_06770 [Deltaproteobacteria bacterium]|nr:hypothetical protein [Deltaproteobacteria bacterium]